MSLFNLPISIVNTIDVPEDDEDENSPKTVVHNSSQKEDKAKERSIIVENVDREVPDGDFGTEVDWEDFV
jgi:hypothetical protein